MVDINRIVFVVGFLILLFALSPFAFGIHRIYQVIIAIIGTVVICSWHPAQEQECEYYGA